MYESPPSWGNESSNKQSDTSLDTGHRSDGDLLMDVDADITWVELQDQANDRDEWRNQ